MQDGISTGANTNFWPKPSTYSRQVAVLQCRWRSKSSIDGASQSKWFHQWTWLCPVFTLPPVCPLALHSWDLTATVPRRLCCLFLYLGLSMSWVCLTSPPPCTLYTLMSSSRDCHSMTCWMSSLSQPAWVRPPFQLICVCSNNTSPWCTYWWSIVTADNLNNHLSEPCSVKVQYESTLVPSNFCRFPSDCIVLLPVSFS